MSDLKRHAHQAHGLEATQLKEAMGFENREKDPRHNQASPYADTSAMKAALRSMNSLGWTSALESIRRLDDFASVNKSLLMGLRNVLDYVTGNTTNDKGIHVTDGSGSRHFKSQQEWDTVDELISMLEKTISTLASKREELHQARNACRKKFLESTVLPETCPTGKRIYPSVDAVRKSGSKRADINGLLQTFQCRECGGVHIGDEQYILTSLENIG